MKTVTELNISERFDLSDIRKIREYNEARYQDMSKDEIIDDIRLCADKVKGMLKANADI